MLRRHAGDPGRARSRAATPSRWATGSRGCCPTCSRPLAGGGRCSWPSRARLGAPRPRRRALAARPRRRSTSSSCPTASASRAARTLEAVYDALPRGRASAATGWSWRSAAGSWATSRASPPRPGCAAWTGWASPPRCSRWSTARSAARSASTTPKAKNMIGAFHQPRAVVIDPAFLARCRVRELRSGRLRGPEVRDPRRPRALRRACARRPAGLRGLGADRPSRTRSPRPAGSRPRSWRGTSARAGLRRVLNLGHTIGHALEAVTGYRRFTHGEAVGWGLVGAAFIARRRGLLPDGGLRRDRRGRRPRRARGRASPTSRAPRSSRRSPATRRRGPGACPSSCPPAIGRVAIHDDVTRGRDRAARCA